MTVRGDQIIGKKADKAYAKKGKNAKVLTHDTTASRRDPPHESDKNYSPIEVLYTPTANMADHQSRAFPLLEMFCSADENKLLSNQSVNLGSRDARPYYVAII